ncbi:AzlC family ABC transporter permease [Aestuariivirga sp.]|uniref:AzlC family ABC transporter permease n=1 Tax=Aestuariivirga sp. TaxID=2650926 RepID=UPI0039E26944
MTKSREFLSGVGVIAPVLVAAIPIGLLWGTLAAGKGLSPAEALLTSALVFAGAAQFVALELWKDPAPILLLTFTALIVNVRHVLMSASLARHLKTIPQRFYPLMAFLLVDESWALSERRVLKQPITLAYYLGLSLPMFAAWCLSTLVGSVVGRSIGDPAIYGIDFAFSALFIAILMGFWKGPRTAAVLAVSGVVAALTKLWLGGAAFIVAGGIAGALCAALLAEEER